MKNILIISALAGVLALSSCWRDDLYYATVDRATVRIEADWTPARLTPNGVSAFVTATARLSTWSGATTPGKRTSHCPKAPIVLSC